MFGGGRRGSNRPLVADPPRRRLPESFQRKDSISSLGVEDESDQMWSEARDSLLPSGSEAESELGLGDSDHALSAEDLEEEDLLDDEEEYRKDMEEQHLADEKNGHFVNVHVQNPSVLDRKAAPDARVSRVSLATHKAKALLKQAMNLDTIMHEGGGEKEGEILAKCAPI